MRNTSLFKGRLIAIGGNEDKVDQLVILKRVVKEVRKKDFKVVIITTASKAPERRGEEYKKVFKNLGAKVIEILNIIERTQANDDNFLKIMQGCDLIFIAGGDQLRLTSILGGSKLLSILHCQLDDGVMIAGTSAGAAVLSHTMIYEGKSGEGLIKGGVLTTTGFSFVDNVIFDTHFMDRGRMGRLIQIITTNPTCIGLGLGEDSGIVLSGDGTVEVIGSGQVIIIDGSNINHSNIMTIASGESIAVENIRIHSIVDGYGFNIKKKQFLTPQQIGSLDD